MMLSDERKNELIKLFDETPNIDLYSDKAENDNHQTPEWMNDLNKEESIWLSDYVWNREFNNK